MDGLKLFQFDPTSGTSPREKQKASSHPIQDRLPENGQDRSGIEAFVFRLHKPAFRAV
jgi:hypothetical protein